MILKETLRGIVESQMSEMSSWEYGVEREKLSEIRLDIPFAIVLSGVRRCGKSTLMRQLMKGTGRFFYFNFEDPRASGFEASDFQKLDEVFREKYGEGDRYFFDEIQSVKDWELFVRGILDRKRHVIITGSNASLLSRELGTRLTGRHLNHELFPFSFEEFTAFTGEKPDLGSFEKYLLKGGFPEYLREGRMQIPQELLNDIVSRDIVVRHGIRNPKTIKDMALYLLTNLGKEFSYNALKRVFELGSTNSAIAFVSYLEDSYLIFTIPRFDFSPKKQLVSQKKVYSIDNGLSATNSLSFSEDRRVMLENAVFLHLRRKYREIFYFKNKNECDFLVKEKGKIVGCYQVCYELRDDNKSREVNGLTEALKSFDLEEGFILTYSQEDEITVGNMKIAVLPVWKWLLQQ